MQRVLKILLWLVMGGCIAWAAPQALQPVLVIEHPPEQAPALQGGYLVYIQGKNLIAFNLSEKRILWRKPAPELFTAGKDLVYTLDENGKLTTYELTTGKLQWTAQALQKPSYLAVHAGNLIISGDGFQLQALDPDSGRERWRRSGPETSFGVIADRYAVFSYGNATPQSVEDKLAIDLLDGKYLGDVEPLLHDKTFNKGRNDDEVIGVEHFKGPVILDMLDKLYDVGLKVFISQSPTGSLKPLKLVQDLGHFTCS
jgi:hypothetical protein